MSRPFRPTSPQQPGDDVETTETTSNPRRQFLLAGGAAAAAALLAACGSKSSSGSSSNDDSTTTTAPTAPGDLAQLRDATSIALAAAAVYQNAIDGKLVTDTNLQTTLGTLQGQHKQHAQLLGSATVGAGGNATTTPNSTMLSGATARLQAAKSQNDVMTLLYDLERQAQATYQNAVGSFKDPSFNQTVMMVGGSVAHHAAWLAPFVGKQVTPDGAFSSTSGAVSPNAA